MKRIYEAHAYGPGPITGSFWESSVTRRPASEPFAGPARADVVVIGAGFTGLSAALHLARDHGCEVTVLEAERVGWGASGRNGGFACIGGAKASDAELASRFGAPAVDEWHRAQIASVSLVDALITEGGIDVDRHSSGEMVLARSARDLRRLQAGAGALGKAYGCDITVLDRDELARTGIAGPTVHGALHFPLGFALNPLKYALGLAELARRAGVRIHEGSPALAIAPDGQGGYAVDTPGGRLTARRLIVATNGYSSEDVPRWMAGRYLPTASNILVTRPLTEDEQRAQGWWSGQMAYDTKGLLHYVRLMPDGRFLFGMRGGTRGTAKAHAEMAHATRREFEYLFPAWAHVETPHFWSGLLCLSRDFVPYAGPIADWPGAFTGFAFHGNGVAMGTWTGALLARLAAGAAGAEVPAIMRGTPRRFPFGRFRRGIVPAAYTWYAFKDWLG